MMNCKEDLKSIRNRIKTNKLKTTNNQINIYSNPNKLNNNIPNIINIKLTNQKHNRLKYNLNNTLNNLNNLSNLNKYKKNNNKK